ncbi:MAG: hypothetical protein ABIR26_10255, partial [Ramlibacter sp.]
MDRPIGKTSLDPPGAARQSDSAPCGAKPFTNHCAAPMRARNLSMLRSERGNERAQPVHLIRLEVG